jgi:hypothetical protein
MKQNDDMVELKVQVRRTHLRALREVVNDLSDGVGGRLAKSMRIPKEQMLTEAAVALGQLRAGITAALEPGR